MLTGGHPNSLGRTEDVVALVLDNQTRLQDLLACYFSQDEVVRLRVSSAMKRVTKAQPKWVIQYMGRLQTEIAAIDQASNQWTLPLLFDMTKELLNENQKERALDIMKFNLANHLDWIVLNNTMQILFEWSREDAALSKWLRPHLTSLSKDKRKSVSKRASKLLTN